MVILDFLEGSYKELLYKVGGGQLKYVLKYIFYNICEIKRGLRMKFVSMKQSQYKGEFQCIVVSRIRVESLFKILEYY